MRFLNNLIYQSRYKLFWTLNYTIKENLKSSAYHAWFKAKKAIVVIDWWKAIPQEESYVRFTLSFHVHCVLNIIISSNSMSKLIPSNFFRSWPLSFKSDSRLRGINDLRCCLQDLIFFLLKSMTIHTTILNHHYSQFLWQNSALEAAPEAILFW